ncbi:unnamed protein product [Sphagnum jensenii]|uniref:Uncharacterized protein n=1 Tax=Sphagnum jensenii TaxID=128206 RepID=A0ABP1C2H3_9BRYO
MCEEDCKPFGFLLGLPFMLLAFAFTLVGVVLWIITAPLACCCPCLICFTVLAKVALTLIKAPVSVMRWFSRKVPC